jgi:hypothetical protein
MSPTEATVTNMTHHDVVCYGTQLPARQYVFAPLFGQRRHASRCRAVRLELPARGNHSRCGHAESDRGVSPTGACLLGSAHPW